MSSVRADTARTPLVSVCVPTYNGARYLDVCLESLLHQDLKDIEIVLADDVSSDETVATARRHRDPRLRILPFDTRAGMAGNWNRSLGEARGKYVALVAQDDLVRPHWGERLVQLLETHPEANLAFGRREFDLADERTRTLVGDFFGKLYPALLESFYSRIETVIPTEVMIGAAMEHLFKINLIGEPSFTMVRRDHPATRAGYHKQMRQLLDWEFALRFCADAPVLHCPEVIGTYRIHAAGESVDKARLSYHYEEYGHLLDSVACHLGGRLSPNQASLLLERRKEIEHVVHLLLHSRNLEAERDRLLLHSRTLATEREHMKRHVENLERIIRKTQAERVYRVLCRIKDTFVGRRERPAETRIAPEDDARR